MQNSARKQRIPKKTNKVLQNQLCATEAYTAATTAEFEISRQTTPGRKNKPNTTKKKTRSLIPDI